MKLDILTLKEASEELKVPMSTMYLYLREGTIRGFKAGKHWRMTREALNEFVTTEENKPPHEKVNTLQGRKRGRKSKGMSHIDIDGSGDDWAEDRNFD